MFLVIREETCRYCSGDKVVINPLWAQFWEHFGNSEGNALTHFQVKSFFRDVLKWDGEELPSEEVDCPECGGTGVIRTEIDLGFALRQIIK